MLGNLVAMTWRPSFVRVLVVEDEVDLGRLICRTLEEEGFTCDLSTDGTDGLFQAKTGPHDLIVLDLMLPEVDGLTILRDLRRSQRATPVLVLTARDLLQEKVIGLNLGADDYLTKPFALEELVARVRALIRRAESQPSPAICIGDVEVHTAHRTVQRAGELVELTGKEYALLELLMYRRGRLVPRSAIYEHIWGDDDDALSNTVEVHISAIRRKLGRDLITTKRGQGYMIQ